MNHQSNISSILYSQVRLISTTSSYSEYFAVQVRSKQEVTLKIQNCLNSNRLQEEAEYLLLIQDVEGIPEVVDYGINRNQRFFLATEKLGPSLTSLIDMSRTFSLKNVLLIGVQLITILQNIHQRKLIHNKVCLNSIHLGIGKQSNRVYLSDFVLMNLKNISTGEFTEQDRDWNFTSHKLLPLNNISYADDLESLGYLLIYLLIGKLPWNVENIGIAFAQIKLLQQSKLNYIKYNPVLAQLPINFRQWFDHLLNLKEGEQPNYTYLKNILMEVLHLNGWILDEQIELEFENETRAKSLSSLQIKTNNKQKLLRSPESLRNRYLSPIVEIEKDFDLSCTSESQKNEKETNKDHNQKSIFQRTNKQLVTFNQIKVDITEDDKCDLNLSLEEFDECEIWEKIEDLEKQGKNYKSISSLEQLS